MIKDDKDLLSEIEWLNIRINELEESEQRFRATLYSIIDGMISVDDKGAILQMNQRAEILTGWNEQDALRHSRWWAFERCTNSVVSHPSPSTR